LLPPVAGRFEFILPIVQALSDPTPQNTVALNLASNFVYDLGKVVFSRLIGKAEKPFSKEVSSLARQAPGDLDAISDALEEDINRIHRPIISNTTIVNVFGGTNAIATLNKTTYDYVTAKVISDQINDFFGRVTSFNGSSIQGRFWLEAEERTIDFLVSIEIKN
jgi:hypothetical protein